jgi:hypothetical protein
MGKPLYELTSDYVQLQQKLDDGEDVTEALGQLSDALEHKALGIVHVLRELDLDIDKIRAEEQRLTARRRAAEANRERLREHVKQTMAATGTTKIKAGTISLSLSEGPDKVVVDDEALIPETYLRIKKEPNKTAIHDAYRETGECVAGSHIERVWALRIR